MTMVREMLTRMASSFMVKGREPSRRREVAPAIEVNECVPGVVMAMVMVLETLTRSASRSAKVLGGVKQK